MLYLIYYAPGRDYKTANTFTGLYSDSAYSFWYVQNLRSCQHLAEIQDNLYFPNLLALLKRKLIDFIPC